MGDSPDEASTSCTGRRGPFFKQFSDLLAKPKIPKLEELFQQHHREPLTVGSVNLKYKYAKDFLRSREFHSTINIEGTLKCNLKLSDQWVEHAVFMKVSPICYIPMDLVMSLDLVQRYQKELHAYRTIIPVLDKFQRDEGPGFDQRDNYRFIFPICFGMRCSLNKEGSNFPDKDGIIVLENLKPKFYQLDPTAALDLHVTLFYVKKLALFHAVSLAFKEKHPEQFLELISPGLAVAVSTNTHCCVPSEVEYIMQRVKRIPALKEHEEVIINAMTYSQNYMPEPPPEDTWVSMCHGRFFPYNLMVCNGDDGLVGDCRMLDLQNLLKRHVLTDLAFLLITSSSKNLLKNHLQDIAKEYHFIFLTVLERFKMDVEPFNYDIFRRELKLSVRKDLLRGMQQLKFMSAKPGKKDMMRTLSSWPKFREDELEKNINPSLYMEKLKDCLLNLIESGLITE